MTVAGQPAVNYTYDNANRLTQIAQGSSTVGFSYDAAGRRTLVTLPNGVTATLGYDAASQLTSILYKLGTTLLGDLTYTYGAGGNRSQVGGTLARTVLPAALASATYDSANQLTQWGATNLTYDANGNMTNDGTSSYTWDARDQVASISGAASASFQYDAFGRRKTRTVGGATIQYLYDGLQAVQELSGGTPAANLLTGLGMDDVFARTDSAGSRSYLSDALGSTVALLDSGGVLQTQYTYGPFGSTTASGAGSTNSLQYAGRENDGTGVYYNRARYYNPSLQRFISEDPVGFAAGINQYAYAENNPVNWTDGTGLWSTFPVGDQHTSLLERALARAPKKYIAIMKECGGFKFDQNTQGPEDSYKHSMSNGLTKQTPADAIAQRNKFVSEALAAARSQALKGGKDNCEAAACTLGQALHPIIDSTSPFHVDPWGNPRPWYGGETPGLSAQHALAEAKTTLTPEVYVKNDSLIGQAYETVFGPRSLAGRKK